MHKRKTSDAETEGPEGKWETSKEATDRDGEELVREMLLADTISDRMLLSVLISWYDCPNTGASWSLPAD